MTDVILIVCCIYFCGTDIWRFLNSRKGYVRIRWIQKSGVDAVKLYNVQYSRGVAVKNTDSCIADSAGKSLFKIFKDRILAINSLCTSFINKYIS